MIPVTERGLGARVSEEPNPQEVRAECVDIIEKALKGMGCLSKEYLKPSDISAPSIVRTRAFNSFADKECPALKDTPLIIFHGPANRNNGGESVCLTTCWVQEDECPQTYARVDTGNFFTKPYQIILPPLIRYPQAFDLKHAANSNVETSDRKAELGEEENYQYVMLLAIKKTKGKHDKHVLRTIKLPKNWREAFNKNGALKPLDEKKPKAAPAKTIVGIPPPSPVFVAPDARPPRPLPTEKPTTPRKLTPPALDKKEVKRITNLAELWEMVKKHSREGENGARRAVLKGSNTGITIHQEPGKITFYFYDLSILNVMGLNQKTYPTITDFKDCFSKKAGLKGSLTIDVQTDQESGKLKIERKATLPKHTKISAQDLRSALQKLGRFLDLEGLSEVVCEFGIKL